MVAFSANKETVIKGMIRPLFEGADGRMWIGESLPPHTLIALQQGVYNDNTSTFVGFEIVGGQN